MNANKKQHKDLKWLKSVIRAIWNFSHEIWVQRCKFVNKADKTNPLSLSHQELISEMRNYTRLPKNELSPEERKLHYNVSKTIRVAHKTTLVKWLDLLHSEREATIRRRREQRNSSRGTMRPLSAYFPKISTPTNNQRTRG